MSPVILGEAQLTGGPIAPEVGSPISCPGSPRAQNPHRGAQDYHLDDRKWPLEILSQERSFPVHFFSRLLVLFFLSIKEIHTYSKTCGKLLFRKS